MFGKNKYISEYKNLHIDPFLAPRTYFIVLDDSVTLLSSFCSKGLVSFMLQLKYITLFENKH